MELKEVIGRRRSIRIFASWRPVEREKIQKMLEAGEAAPVIFPKIGAASATLAIQSARGLAHSKG